MRDCPTEERRLWPESVPIGRGGRSGRTRLEPTWCTWRCGCRRSSLPSRHRHAQRSASQENGLVIYRFTVGRLSCAVISDGQMTPPWEPPLAAVFTPAAGGPEHELHTAWAAEGQRRTTLSCGYNCVLVQTSHGHAVIDTGLGARFLGYGPSIEPLVGRLGDGLASAGAPAAELAAVVFTHLHQDHCRG